MYIGEPEYNNFILSSLFYDNDDIISFFNNDIIIKNNFSIEIKKDAENFDLIETVSNKLEYIILNNDRFIISKDDNKKLLKSIFTTFKKHNINKEFDKINLNDIKYYPISIIKNRIIYPYKEKEEEIKNNFNDLKNLEKIIDSNNINIILNRLYAIFSYIPYYKNNNEEYNSVGDISFYDKLKINTALSSCLYILKNNGELDKNKLSSDEYNHFVLLSGDISGIQKFIYTISSKGALKSLRARSFYLEIMLEHIADEILEYFNLTRCNLLYTGGGHFYLILPNHNDIENKINEIMYKLNDWFIDNFSVDLYIAMGVEEFCFDDLKDFASVFKKLSYKLSKNKQRRYLNIKKDENKKDIECNKKLLEKLLFINETNKYNHDRECSVCHTSSKKIINTKELGDCCSTCYNLYKSGKYILSEKCNLFVVEDINSLDEDYIVGLPPINKDRYLYFDEIKEGNFVRVYSKNDINSKYINLFMGDYNFKDHKYDSSLIDFETLVNGTKNDPTYGINRLAVLRCDVDNLGDAFIKGFRGYADILRTSSFSRHLSLFFKYYIKFICEGNTQFYNKRIFGDLYYNSKKRIVIVYSGGDDVFLVGHWIDVINFSFDLREAFRRYTNDSLTFSAGIGFFHSSYPISKMASQTGELEELSKNNKYNNKEKDSISLFGIPNNKKYGCLDYCFNWNEFEKVQEKITIIFDACCFDENSKFKDKVFLSASFIYKLKQLIYKEFSKNEKINIARLAYSLTSIKSKGSEEYNKNYKNLKNNIYNWFLDYKERKYLNTALDLIIYLYRVDSNDN